MRKGSRALVGVLIVGLALGLSGMAAPVASAQGETVVPVCCPVAALEQGMGTLAVTVQIRGAGGAPPPPGMQAPAAQPMGVGAGVPVQALAHDGSEAVVAQAVTDAEGQATLEVPPGTYWVVVPASGGLPGLPGAGALTSLLPGGTRVHVYQEATVAAGEAVPVTLAIMIMLP